jgi:NTE family protein
MRGIGVAFSGGGYRAAAFALGVVHYLNDVDRLKDVSAISSVSGGSITNGFLATRMTGDLRSPSELRREFAMLSSGLANVSLVNVALLGVLLYLVAVPVVAVVVLAGLGRIPLVTKVLLSAVLDVLGAVTMVEPLIKARLRFLLRDPCRPTLRKKTHDQRLRSGEATMGDLAAARYAPVFCATDLATGTAFYVSGGFVAGASALLASRRSELVAGEHGVTGSPATVPLRSVIMASAAFPGLLPPQLLDSESLGLPLREGSVLRKTYLADGGLRDNLGVGFFESWTQGTLPGPSAGISASTPSS